MNLKNESEYHEYVIFFITVGASGPEYALPRLGCWFSDGVCFSVALLHSTSLHLISLHLNYVLLRGGEGPLSALAALHGRKSLLHTAGGDYCCTWKERDRWCASEEIAPVHRRRPTLYKGADHITAVYRRRSLLAGTQGSRILLCMVENHQSVAVHGRRQPLHTAGVGICYTRHDITAARGRRSPLHTGVERGRTAG